MKQFLRRGKDKKDKKGKKDDKTDSEENDSEVDSECEEHKNQNTNGKRGKEGKKTTKNKQSKKTTKHKQNKNKQNKLDRVKNTDVIDSEETGSSENDSEVELENRNKIFKDKGDKKGKKTTKNKQSKNKQIPRKQRENDKSEESDVDSEQDFTTEQTRKKPKKVTKVKKSQNDIKAMEKKSKTDKHKDRENDREISELMDGKKKSRKKKTDDEELVKYPEVRPKSKQQLKKNSERDENKKSRSAETIKKSLTKHKTKSREIEMVESDDDTDDEEEEEECQEEEEEEEADGCSDSESEESGSDTIKEMSALKKSSKKTKIPLEKQAKFYQDRAVSVEKHYGQFCQVFGSITRKVARTRDKGDLLSKQLLEYAKQEKINHTTSKNLKEFAQNLATVQDYRDAEIRRLETKVVKPLSAYGNKCKQIKQLVKKEQGAINREIKQRKNLEKVRDKKPGDAQSIAETEVKKAAESAQIGLKGLQNQMCTFEKEKITDLKDILAAFVSIELVFHAKAIEFYSQCFDNLAMIDEDMDLEEFKRQISLEASSRPIPTGTITSIASEQMMSTLNSTGNSEYTSTGASYTYTYGESTNSSAGDKRQSMYADDDDDDDDEDDDDDDEYEDEEDEVQNYSRPVRR